MATGKFGIIFGSIEHVDMSGMTGLCRCDRGIDYFVALVGLLVVCRGLVRGET